MPSTITQFSNRIDINFPVVGADNNTQGFRDNFTNIQNAFSVAASEITQIQNNGVKLTQDNDFQGNVIRNAVLQNCGEISKTTQASTTVTNYAYINVDYGIASYQKFNMITPTSSASIYSFTIVNWPAADRYARLNLELKPSTTSTCTISILGNTSIIGNSSATITVRSTASIFYELWSVDSGNSIFGRRIG